jgi:hypothetical protein
VDASYADIRLHYLELSPTLPPTLPLKLVLTPALIATATMVERRWGHAVSGWLVGLPLTSAPVVFFLALDQGGAFATTAALGVILGVTSQAAFALAYVWSSRQAGWRPRVLAGTVAFAVATVIFQLVRIPGTIEPVFVFLTLVIAIALLPRAKKPPNALRVERSSDLPLRIIVATALVVGLTAIAPMLGARLSGLLSPFPLYAGILAVFAHRLGGDQAALAVWRGLLYGLFSFLGFFSVVAAALVPLGIGLAFVSATVVALLVQGASLFALRAVRPPN